MPIRNANWYDLQSTRRYPLHDRSTGVDNDGQLIRDNIIVDCNIKYPSTYGDVAFIQSITVSPGIVTVIIAAADNEQATTSTAIAAVTVAKPIQLSKNYPVQPLVAGVAGWFVFGDGVIENFTGRYATPIQTLLIPQNARAYRALPVTSIKKSNVSTSLTGLVSIEVAAPIVANLTDVEIAGKPTRALVFSLDGNITDVAYNPLSYFLGPCAQRPESGTCPNTPIESINGVAPDCNGNIQLKVAADAPDGPLSIYPFKNCGGLGIHLNIDLPEICGPRKYDPPREANDQCTTSSSSSSSM
jgi:hypothetical protein